MRQPCSWSDQPTHQSGKWPFINSQTALKMRKCAILTFLWIIFISLWSQKVSEDIQVHTVNGSPLYEKKKRLHTSLLPMLCPFLLSMHSVTDMFHMHLRSLTSPNIYIVFTKSRRQMKLVFITEYYTFQESSIIFHPV